MTEEQKNDSPEKKASDVRAESVSIRQGGAIHVEADKVEVRQGGVVNAKAKSLEITGGGLLLGQTENARLIASKSGAVIAQHDVEMDQCGTMLQISRGDVTMEQCGAVVQVANHITMGDNNGTVFMFAKNVDGDVHTAFGHKESVTFGVVAGLTAGLVLLAGSLLSRGKK